MRLIYLFRSIVKLRYCKITTLFKLKCDPCEILLSNYIVHIGRLKSTNIPTYVHTHIHIGMYIIGTRSGLSECKFKD